MRRLLLLLLALSFGAAAFARDGVVLLHGLARTSRSMADLETALAGAGYTVVNVEYPSRTTTIATLSERVIPAALADERLQGAARIHFVTHSLGGILVRSYFARHADPRLGRVVMLGPPNHGSEVVDRLRSWWLFQKLNGPAGQELGTEATSVPNGVGPVTFELGVIAGDRSINWINSRMIPGPDDGKVSIASTRVEGMKEHLVVHASHPFIMSDSEAIAACIRFLATGSFAPTAAGRQVLTRPAPRA